MIVTHEKTERSQQQFEQAERAVSVLTKKAAALSETVSEQQQKLEESQQMIVELLKALHGKQRERIDPDQLLLFELGQLEQLIAEQHEAAQR